MSLQQRRVLLGVSGGIAAYKACDLVRRLREVGAEVQVVMTEGATRFVAPLTFQALSGRPVRSGLWDEAAEAAMGHIELARWAECVLVAPASADLLARLAHGHGDDLLSTLCLATAAPLLVAPAMNRQMWAHAAVQANVGTLRDRGVTVLGPAAGDQACGEVGSGRMLEPTELRDALAAHFGGGVLRGRRVVISAGPTFEDIDPVRFIGNRSSGRMGFALAAAAAGAGAEVTLVDGPVHLATPAGVACRVDVRSARQMHEAVLAAVDGADAYLATAAVGDYRPRQAAELKMKKQDGAPLTLELAENPDIVADVSRLPRRPFILGFAAETHDLATYARDKLARKGMDLIAANLVGGECGFESDDNALTLYWPGGEKTLPRASKSTLARALIEEVAARLPPTGSTDA